MATAEPHISPPLAPRLVGHVGLWASVAAAVACVVLAVSGLRWLGQAPYVAVGEGAGPRVAAGLLVLPVAALSGWLFAGFLRLPDWMVAQELPLGLKLLGHLGRVVGSVVAAACLALAVLTALFPGYVPPHPMRLVDGVWLPLEAGAPGLAASRPGLAGAFVLGFLGALVVRVLGTAVSEMRRWARLGTLCVLGGAVALLTVALVLNLTRWRMSPATLPLAIGDALALVAFLGLLVYFALPRVIDAFEAHGL